MVKFLALLAQISGFTDSIPGSTDPISGFTNLIPGSNDSISGSTDPISALLTRHLAILTRLMALLTQFLALPDPNRGFSDSVQGFTPRPCTHTHTHRPLHYSLSFYKLLLTLYLPLERPRYLVLLARFRSIATRSGRIYCLTCSTFNRRNMANVVWETIELGMSRS